MQKHFTGFPQLHYLKCLHVESPVSLVVGSNAPFLSARLCFPRVNYGHVNTMGEQLDDVPWYGVYYHMHYGLPYHKPKNNASPLPLNVTIVI